MQQHKLFSRLSGQVVWNLAEEAGASVPQLDAFMEFFEAQKARAAALLTALADAPDAGVALFCDDPAAACPACARLHGAVIAAARPDVLDYLPPFGLGCRLAARPATAQEVLAAADAPLPPPPPHTLCCDVRPLTKLLAELPTAKA